MALRRVPGAAGTSGRSRRSAPRRLRLACSARPGRRRDVADDGMEDCSIWPNLPTAWPPCLRLAVEAIGKGSDLVAIMPRGKDAVSVLSLGRAASDAERRLMLNRDPRVRVACLIGTVLDMDDAVRRER